MSVSNRQIETRRINQLPRKKRDDVWLSALLAWLVCSQVTISKDSPKPMQEKGAQNAGPVYLEVGKMIQRLDPPTRINSYAELERAVQANPKWALGYVYMANAELQDGDSEAASKDINKALLLEPGLALAHIARSRVYQSTGHWQEAFGELQKAAALGPPDIAFKTLFESSYLHRERKEYVTALAEYDTLLKLKMDPLARAKVTFLRGEVYHRTGKIRLAVNDYNRALQLCPTLFVALVQRGTAYFQLNQLDQALADANVMIDLDRKYEVDNRSSAYKLRAQVYESMGKHDLAKADLKSLADHQQGFFKEMPFRMP